MIHLSGSDCFPLTTPPMVSIRRAARRHDTLSADSNSKTYSVLADISVRPAVFLNSHVHVYGKYTHQRDIELHVGAFLSHT